MTTDLLQAPCVDCAEPPVSIVSVASWPADSADVRALVHEYIDWLTVASGEDVAAVQPSLLDELEAIEQWYAPPNGRMVLVRVDGQATGIAGVHMLGDQAAELKRVYLRPTARGQNLGRRMIDASIREARRLGAKRLLLETAPALMPAAHRIYLERGFRPTDNYSGMEVDGVVAMERPIGLFASLRPQYRS